MVAVFDLMQLVLQESVAIALAVAGGAAARLPGAVRRIGRRCG